MNEPPDSENPARRRRPRYPGRNPRRFEDRYKELNPEKFGDTVARVMESGRTPAGMHRPIMVREIIEALRPGPGQIAVDATLGWGGHSREILPLLSPSGRLIGLDCDPLELPKTVERMRSAGFGPEVFAAHRTNYSGLPKILAMEQIEFVDIVLADLGLSSMQIDNPARGFTFKSAGPLDMRMNPAKGLTAADYIERSSASVLADVIDENADEPDARQIAAEIAGRHFQTTRELADAVRKASSAKDKEGRDMAARRVFQAIRIEINEEFKALETFLRVLPDCVKPGGRIAILTFHSGEDRRVKKAFKEGVACGLYSEASRDVIRAGAAEQQSNPRSCPAKLRWAIRA